MLSFADFYERHYSWVREAIGLSYLFSKSTSNFEVSAIREDPKTLKGVSNLVGLWQKMKKSYPEFTSDKEAERHLHKLCAVHFIDLELFCEYMEALERKQSWWSKWWSKVRHQWEVWRFTRQLERTIDQRDKPQNIYDQRPTNGKTMGKADRRNKTGC